MQKLTNDRTLFDEIRHLPLSSLSSLQFLTQRVLQRCTFDASGHEEQLLNGLSIASAFLRKVRRVCEAARQLDPLAALKVNTSPSLEETTRLLWNNFNEANLRCGKKCSFYVLSSEVESLQLELTTLRTTALDTLVTAGQWNESGVLQLLNNNVTTPASISFEPASYVKSIIRDELDSEEVLHTRFTLKLQDPLTLMRLQTPVRSSCCHHLEALDLASFVQSVGQALKKSNPKAPEISQASFRTNSDSVDDYLNAYDSAITRQDSSAYGAGEGASQQFPCPICNKKIELSSLYHDYYLKGVLDTVPKNVLSISIDPVTGKHVIMEVDEDSENEIEE